MELNIELEELLPEKAKDDFLIEELAVTLSEGGIERSRISLIHRLRDFGLKQPLIRAFIKGGLHDDKTVGVLALNIQGSDERLETNLWSDKYHAEIEFIVISRLFYGKDEETQITYAGLLNKAIETAKANDATFICILASKVRGTAIELFRQCGFEPVTGTALTLDLMA